MLGIFYAFTDWNSYSTELNLVGLDNFAAIFSSGSTYLRVIGNTIVFTVATIILKTVIALGLALLLTEGDPPALVLPSGAHLSAGRPADARRQPRLHVDPEPRHRPAQRRRCGAVGLDVFAQQWLTDVSLAMSSVIAVDVWRGVGYIMVILIAGLQAIPRDYYEAASIDGASGRQAFRHITLPLLMPVLAVTTVLNLLYGLKVFDIVFVLTSGGPGRATDTVYTDDLRGFLEGPLRRRDGAVDAALPGHDRARLS